MSYRALVPIPAIGHMPFKGHRTCEEVRQDEDRRAILHSLGRDAPKRRRAA